jgi:Protein of unknown function (DUF3667)
MSNSPKTVPGTETALLATAPHTACRNCGFAWGDKKPNYCPQCGQDTHEHPPSLLEFVHEFVTHYVALEGKLWKTLGLLFFAPGQLTKHFSAGRKLRYVSPLRLYITASFVFFLVVKIAGFGNIVNTSTSTTTTSTDTTVASPSTGSTTSVKPLKRESKSAASTSSTEEDTSTDTLDRSKPATKEGIPDEVLKGSLQANFECKPDESVCLWLENHVKEKWKGKTNADVIAALKAGVISNLPYAMFFMLPVFALITKTIYWRRQLYFGDHMVYAMHVHAFAFFTLLAKATLPRVLGDIVLSLSMLYYFVAMQRYFGGRWWLTCLRYAFVGTLYPLLLVMLTGFIIVFSLAI